MCFFQEGGQAYIRPFSLPMFEGTADITHTIQRWRLELLSLNFTIVHRPARMLVECDLLSRYQGVVETWRDSPEKTHTNNPITATAWNIIHPETEWPIQHIKPTIIAFTC